MSSTWLEFLHRPDSSSEARAEHALAPLDGEAAMPEGGPSMAGVADVDRAQILEDLCARIGIGLVICDADDRVVWMNRRATEQFPEGLDIGATFRPALESLLLANGDDEGLAVLRHFELPFDASVSTLRVHCLSEASGPPELEQQLRSNLGELASKREIIDTLHESLSTREVIYLILIAVTADLGFGFNRAFYLQATGERLRGKMGIGPSSHEDAWRIWQRIDDLNLSTLRDLYQNMTKDGETPDPETNEIAARMELPLTHDEESALCAAVRACQPSVLHATRCESAIDRDFFAVIASDEVAVVPLHVDGNLAGVLIADNFVTRKSISQTDLDVLRSFSRYAAVALERSSLYDQLSANVDELQSANAELKNHQERLIRAEKLSALGKLAAEVTHEIRNPLVIIGGHARSLLACSEQQEEDRESLEHIVREVDRLERYLTEALDFARPDEADTQRCELRETIKSCVSPLGRELDERSIQLDLELGAHPLWCQIDTGCFHRALGNLLKNSMEAVGECGAIHVQITSTEHVARIALSDTGGGIEPELHDRVFDPFFTTKAGGTGLGMAIAAESIRTVGGYISLQVDDRFGSIFVVEIPLDESLVREEQEEHPVNCTEEASNTR